MRDFHEEHSILHELAARLAERRAGHFNGKSSTGRARESLYDDARHRDSEAGRAPGLCIGARALKLRLGTVRLVSWSVTFLMRQSLAAPQEDVLSSLIPQHYSTTFGRPGRTDSWRRAAQSDGSTRPRAIMDASMRLLPR